MKVFVINVIKYITRAKDSIKLWYLCQKCNLVYWFCQNTWCHSMTIEVKKVIFFWQNDFRKNCSIFFLSNKNSVKQTWLAALKATLYASHLLFSAIFVYFTPLWDINFFVSIKISWRKKNLFFSITPLSNIYIRNLKVKHVQTRSEAIIF